MQHTSTERHKLTTTSQAITPDTQTPCSSTHRPNFWPFRRYGAKMQVMQNETVKAGNYAKNTPTSKPRFWQNRSLVDQHRSLIPDACCQPTRFFEHNTIGGERFTKTHTAPTRSCHYTYEPVHFPKSREKSSIHSKTPSLEGSPRTQMPPSRANSISRSHESTQTFKPQKAGKTGKLLPSRLHAILAKPHGC